MLSEDQIWIVNAKLEGKLTNRKIASVQGISIRMVQQLYSEYKTANYMFIKRLGDINSLCLSKLNMKSLSFTKYTEPMRAISAKFSERKDTTLTTTGSIKYSRRLALQ